MKILATFFVCCMVLAAAKAAIAILAIAILFALVWGAIFRPAQTYGFIATCFIASLFSRYPVWCLAAIVLVAAVTALRTNSSGNTNYLDMRNDVHH